MTTGIIRIDKWLFFARFFKSRTLAQKLLQSGRLRRNGDLIGKAHATLKPGDVLTFPKGTDIRVIRVAQLGHRRGPAVEAQSLYEDLEPPEAKRCGDGERIARTTGRAAGAGRPTKADRRAIDKLLDRD